MPLWRRLVSAVVRALGRGWLMRIVVFLWHFIVGDQPWLAFGVVSVALVTLLVRTVATGWLLVPVFVVIVLALSLRKGLGFPRRTQSSDG